MLSPSPRTSSSSFHPQEQGSSSLNGGNGLKQQYDKGQGKHGNGSRVSDQEENDGYYKFKLDWI